MARRTRRHGRRSKTIPILSIGAAVIPVVAAVKEQLQGGDGIAEYVKSYVPYNLATRQVDTSGLVQGWGPVAVVVGVRLARRMGIPIPNLGPIGLR